MHLNFQIKKGAFFRCLSLSFLLVCIFIYSNGQTNLAVELSTSIGYHYQPAKSLINKNDFVQAPQGLSLKILPFVTSNISLIDRNHIHKLGITFGSWQHTFSYNNKSMHHSNGENYWFVDYKYARRWRINTNRNGYLQLGAGPILAVLQKTDNIFLNRIYFIENGNEYLINLQNIEPSSSALGFSLEHLINFPIYNSVSLHFGINAIFWFKPTYTDRLIDVRINSIALPESSIRSYKHILSFFVGVTFDIN